MASLLLLKARNETALIFMLKNTPSVTLYEKRRFVIELDAAFKRSLHAPCRKK
jgi:hypothetical protein